MRIIFLFGIVFIFASPLAAQLQRVMHQSFALDTARYIRFDLPGAYQVEAWAGDNILTETKVQLYDASDGILRHFIEKGRYELAGVNTGDTLMISAVDQKREPIRTLEGECREKVDLRIFLPDNYAESGGHLWVRPRKEE